jgi:hypothetical protein
MPQISTTQKPAQKRDRVFGALLSGGKVLVVSFAKTIYALWLEVTGLLFAVFAVGFGSGLLKQYHKDHFGDHKRFSILAVSFVVCLYFTVVSFTRAKKSRK